MGDLREELESAFEDEELEDEQGETEDEAEEEESSEGEGDDEGETDGEDSGDDPDEEADDSVGDTGTKIGDGEGKEDPPGIGAPLGFSPESREQWKDVPQIVKEQIQKRETEIETAMRGTAEARRSHAHLTQLSQSYAPIMAAEGASNPMEAIEGLFRTVAELRVGSPQQTATKMAQLIGHYGIDITMLDQALAGEAPQSNEIGQMQQMLDQRLGPIQDMMNKQQQGVQDQQQQAQAQVNNELATFGKTAEFLNDVRYDMADLIDLASKQGRKMSFQDAYNKACAMNPSISKVLGDRASAESLKNSGERQVKKKNASSSLKGKGGMAPQNKGNQSLRGEIESLWEDYE